MSTPTKKKSPSRRATTSVATVPDTQLIKANPEFLQRLRLYWQLGDWAELEALSAQDIKTYDARAECALYIAAACFQLGLLEKGKTYQDLALQWGASKQDIGRVLISGVYNTLGTASALADSQTSNAIPYFVTAAQIALPGIAVAPVMKARTQNQIESLTKQPEKVVLDAIQLLTYNKNQTLHLSSIDQLKTTLEKFYQFDNELNIWCRNEQYQFAYTDGQDTEERILKAIKACEDVSVFSRELLQHQIDWASEYHLSADRVNLLRPFANLLKDAHVLELGCGCGAITRFLGESGAAQVIAVEGSHQRASIASERCRDLANVSVVLDKLQETPFQQQFDVVTLIGVLEYSRIYVDAEDPIQFVLEKAKSYLKPDGVLIVAIENQLGLKYFAGAPEDHGVGIMAGINDNYGANTPVTFGKKELEQRFIKAGFVKVDTHLALPDYKLPCLIVHPAGYNTESFDLGNLLTGTVFYDRQGIANPLFSLESSWPLISRNGLAADLANSHLFVVHNTESSRHTSESILASYYSPKRSAETSQEVRFHLQHDEVTITRRRLINTESASSTSEPYMPGILHSQLLNRIVQRPGWTLAEVEQWLQQWLDKLEQSLVTEVDAPQGWTQYDKWLPANYIDALPRNLIIGDKGFSQFIDLEWTLPHNLPLALVLYRGLVITLSTISSIAEPVSAELIQRQELLNTLMRYCGYSLTTEEYAQFVPLMENLSRMSQGVAPISTSTLHMQPILLKPFDVRQPVGNRPQNNTCMTLYWKRADTQFCEENTVKYQYPINTKRQCINLSLPPQEIPYSKLRLDIAEKPGCYQIFELTLLDKNNSLLWNWNFDINQLQNIAYLTFYHAADNQGGICMLSNDYDPQFEFNLPSEVLIQISDGGHLMIDFCAYA